MNFKKLKQESFNNNFISFMFIHFHEILLVKRIDSYLIEYKIFDLEADVICAFVLCIG